MKKGALLFTILFCCIFNARAQEQIEPEEYEVYKALLNNMHFITRDAKQIFIMKFTADHWDGSTFLPKEKIQQLSQVRSSTLKDYKLRNSKSLELKNNFGVSANVNLIPENLVTFLRSGAPYEDFVKKAGAEYGIALSRVGFNKKKNQALIHVDFRNISDPKFAFGYYFLLSKKDGNWIIKQRVKSWEY